MCSGRKRAQSTVAVAGGIQLLQALEEDRESFQEKDNQAHQRTPKLQERELKPNLVMTTKSRSLQESSVHAPQRRSREETPRGLLGLMAIEENDD